MFVPLGKSRLARERDLIMNVDHIFAWGIFMVVIRSEIFTLEGIGLFAFWKNLEG